MAKMKYFSGFGSCSIVTTYAKELGFECGLLNELDPLRAQWAQETFRHQGLNDAEVIQGDFTDPKIFKALLRKFRKRGLEMALFSPCCQPFSKAGKQHLDSPEAFLFLDIIKFIRKGRPLYSWIENAAEFLDHVGLEIGRGRNVGLFLKGAEGTRIDGSTALVLHRGIA